MKELSTYKQAGTCKYKQLGICILLWLILLLPNIFALFAAEDLHVSFIKTAGYLLITLACLLLPAFVFKVRTYFLLEGVVCLFFAPIELASLHLNHRPTSDLFLQSIFATNPQEAAEVVTSVWWLCIIVLTIWVAYFILASRLDNRYIFSKQVNYCGSGGVLLLLVALYCAMWLHVKHVAKELPTREVSVRAWESTMVKWDKIYPYNIYRGCRYLLQEKHKVQEMQKEIEHFSFGIQPKDSIGNELYILFIGESSRYDHWGINGYERNTSPRLSSIPNLVSYSSVYSQANLTMHSVPLLLTRATAATADIQNKEKGLSDAFAEAGYTTAFITRNETTSFINRIMEDCNYHYAFSQLMDIDFANDCDSYDADILTKVREARNDRGQMMILHSLGSHYKYSLRYPISENMFTPSFGRTDSYRLMNEAHKPLIINAYDNTIHYTDKVLGDLIAYVDSLQIPAVVVYISDHGESFWDDEHKFSMHGSYIPVEAEYHVPFFVWYSESYAQQHPDKVQQVSANRDVPITSQVVFHSLLDMADICTIADSTYSICSPYLQSQDTICVISGGGQLTDFIISEHH